MHDNHKGPKIFTNYQRIALIVLYVRSRKALRDFVKSLYESRWPMWLELREIPSKSSLHNWLKKYDMGFVRKLIEKSVEQESPSLMAIDATGIDSWQRSRHYEKRIGESNMQFAKADILVDTDNKLIYGHMLKMKPRHDVVGAKSIFKRMKHKHVLVLGDKGYDSEPLHKIAEQEGFLLWAPVRNMSPSPPKGKHRKRCAKHPPNRKGMRSIAESVIRSLKSRLPSLRSRTHYMKKREFAWHILTYNLEVFAHLINQLRWMIKSSSKNLFWT